MSTSSLPPIKLPRVVFKRKSAAYEQHADLHILRLIDEGTAAETGVGFFRALVQRLAQALDAKYSFVSRFCDDNARLQVLAMWNGDAITDNFSYPLPRLTL